MIAKIMVILVLLGVASRPTSAEIIAGPVYYPANGHSYYLLSPNTWTVAQEHAVQLGGHLATVNDRAECNFIFSTFSQFAGIPRPLWIGLTDKDHEGIFTWTNGEPLTFTNWSASEPNNNAGLGTPEHYVFLIPVRGAAGGWRDTTEAAQSDLDDNPAKWSDTGDDFGAFGLVEVIGRVPVEIRLRAEWVDGFLRLSCLTVAGVSYQVQTTRDVLLEGWTDYGPPITGDGAVKRLLEEPVADPIRLFRVMIP